MRLVTKFLIVTTVTAAAIVTAHTTVTIVITPTIHTIRATDAIGLTGVTGIFGLERMIDSPGGSGCRGCDAYYEGMDSKGCIDDRPIVG